MSRSHFMPMAALLLTAMGLPPVFAQSAEPTEDSDAPLTVDDIYAIEDNAVRLENEAATAKYKKELRKACNLYKDAASEMLDAAYKFEIFIETDSSETEEKEQMALVDMNQKADLMTGRRDLACLDAIKAGV